MSKNTAVQTNSPEFLLGHFYLFSVDCSAQLSAVLLFQQKPTVFAVALEAANMEANKYGQLEAYLLILL